MHAHKNHNRWSIVRSIRRTASFMGAATVLWLVCAIPARAATVSNLQDQSDQPSDGWQIKHDKKMGGFGTFENVLIGKEWKGQESRSFSIAGIDGDSIRRYTDSHDGSDGPFFAAFAGDIEHDKQNGHGNWYGDDCHRCTKGAYFSGEAPAPVPVPAAAWLFGSGLAGLFGLASRRRTKTT